MLRQKASVDGNDSDSVTIDLHESVSLSFALKYLTHFTKATPLSDQVTLSLSNEAPLSVCYDIGDMGHIKYFLAPKIELDED